MVQGSYSSAQPVLGSLVQRLSCSTSRTPPDAVINIKSNPIPPHVGYVALLADDKVSRGQWNYDLVEKVRFGKDISIKSLDVRTQNGNTLTGAVLAFYPLEITSATTEPSARNGITKKTKNKKTASNASLLRKLPCLRQPSST